MMACALWKPFAKNPEAVEDDFAQTRSKYDDEEYGHVQKAFCIVVEALERRREEFLGRVLEEIGAANTRNGQFLTPNAVASLMAKARGNGISNHKAGEIIRISDPACGASVLMIAQAEELVAGGVPQGDVLVEVGDIDRRACDISYVELTLLGYAAKVEHVDALSMQRYGETRYTAGYFLHGMPMRLLGRQMFFNL